eukprot:scaffold1465_cov179-Amphora_coffeaeformis.AAC.9
MIISALLLSLAFVTVEAQPKPKMLTDIVPQGRRRLSAPDNALVAESSVSATFMERCSPSNPLQFPISAGEGKGMIGLMSNNSKASTGVSLEFLVGSLEIDYTNKEPNVFSAISDGAEDGTIGIPFTYADVPDSGAMATLQCTEDVEILFVHQDRSGYALEYQVSTEKSITGKRASTGNIRLPKDRAVKPVSGKAIGLGGNAPGRRLNKNNDQVDIHDETDTEISFDADGPGNVVLVQVELEEDGKTIYRSILTETRSAPRDVVAMELDRASVNDDGDLDLYFRGIPVAHVLVKALISIQLQGKPLPDQLELSGMVDDGHLVLHGGWIRTALEKQGSSGASHGWKVVVSEAAAFDPNDSYNKVAELQGSKDSVVSKNKQRLSDQPSPEERGISEEMKTGRRPASNRRLRSRKLAGIHKKILVHGYCSSGNPWAGRGFTDSLLFSDPDVRRDLGGTNGGNNWSNDLFAQKIDRFADDNNLHGCSIIAHSQGGLAALHLYTYYWSCLDNGGPGRMIQSVGSPYQGTPLAGNLAAIGDVFGAGCGVQNDLTTSGASAWLSSIPTWARSQVHYYTTSFTDKWWRYDYCSLGTDLFLGDPEDGVVERGRGQLPGGLNRGDKTGWCHSTDMRDPPQYTDGSRNSEMNALAAL